jgi:hypothetical protein
MNKEKPFEIFKVRFEEIIIKEPTLIRLSEIINQNKLLGNVPRILVVYKK